MRMRMQVEALHEPSMRIGHCPLSIGHFPFEDRTTGCPRLNALIAHCSLLIALIAQCPQCPMVEHHAVLVQGLQHTCISRSSLLMNLAIHEAQRAGSSLAQAGGLGMDVMECRRPVGRRFPFNSSCISPALQAGPFLSARFPGRCPGLRHRAPLALVHGLNSRPKLGCGHYPQRRIGRPWRFVDTFILGLVKVP
jgi:hypothetical protein